MNFRVEDSLIFMCAAHGKKYGSFPLKKLQLSLSKSWLTLDFLNMESVVSVCREAGWALRLKLNEN